MLCAARRLLCTPAQLQALVGAAHLRTKAHEELRRLCACIVSKVIVTTNDGEMICEAKHRRTGGCHDMSTTNLRERDRNNALACENGSE
eukprot:6208797-Pleurochrysis_carterae.AAC.2